MKLQMKVENDYSEYDFIFSKLPLPVEKEIKKVLSGFAVRLEEIRLHVNSPVLVQCSGKILKVPYVTDFKTISDTFLMLCDHSIYSHYDTIKEGYIAVGNGVRAGVCGRAVYEGNKITAVCDINSIVIRIPHRIVNASLPIFHLLKEKNFSTSLLLYSAPGVGKTTVLRDLICKLGEENIRFAVIDTREELTSFLPRFGNANIYLSYPKGLAIELCVKSMSPQYIICDEISSVQEAEEIYRASFCGVSFIATTHAGSYEELCRKESMKSLLEHRVFDEIIGLFRTRSQLTFTEYQSYD